MGPLAVSKCACLFVFDHPETMMRMMLPMINIIVIVVTMIIFVRLNIQSLLLAVYIHI